jgi:hypothetical protein
MNEFFKVIRLRTGEFIVGKTRRDFSSFTTESIIRLYDPLIASMLPTGGAEYVLNRWMPLSDSEYYDLTVDMILTMGNMRRDVKGKYLRHLELLGEREDRHAQSQAIAKLLLSVQPDKTEIHIVEVDEFAPYRKEPINDSSDQSFIENIQPQEPT